MKNLIKKILRESSNENKDDGLDWMREIPMALPPDYFSDMQHHFSVSDMVQTVMEQEGVVIIDAIELMWYSFPTEAEDAYLWEVLLPKVFKFEGAEYYCGVDNMTGVVYITPNDHNPLDLVIYATPNWDGNRGVIPINFMVNSEDIPEYREIYMPRFISPKEMMDYYKNQYFNDVMVTSMGFLGGMYDLGR